MKIIRKNGLLQTASSSCLKQRAYGWNTAIGSCWQQQIGAFPWSFYAKATEPTMAGRFSASFVVALLLGLERGPDGQVSGTSRLRATACRTLAPSNNFIVRGEHARAFASSRRIQRRRPGKTVPTFLSLLGSGATETIVDPGQAVVVARLSDTVTGDLSADCTQAIARWYSRIGRSKSWMKYGWLKVELRADEGRLGPGRIYGVVMAYNRRRLQDRAEMFLTGSLHVAGLWRDRFEQACTAENFPLCG